MERQFQYKPLGDPGDSIRLLTLLPTCWKRSKKIPACLLHEVKLSTSPHYTTISYVWGDPTEHRVVVVNGRVARITHNLYDALLALRHPKKCRIIWVDALCINQQDDREKSQQVRLMSIIYERSTSAIGWLGPSDGTSDTALELLNNIGRAANLCLKFGISFLLHFWEELLCLEPLPEPRKHFDDLLALLPDAFVTTFKARAESLLEVFNGLYQGSGRAQLESIDLLLTRPFWSRIWIFQEVSLPKAMVFICGEKEITRARLSDSVQAYRASWMVFGRAVVANPMIRITFISGFHHNSTFMRPSLMLLYSTLGSRSCLSLAALLCATSNKVMAPQKNGYRDLTSTKPEDRIFALLGLATDRSYFESQGIAADYSHLYQDVYTAVMTALLRQGHVCFLSMCQTYGLRHDIPSWVPDWSLSITYRLQDVEGDHVTPYPAFSASGSPASSPLSVDFQDFKGKLNKMIIPGHLYDTVHAKGYFPTRKHDSEVPLSESKLWPTAWLLECLRLSYLVPSPYENLEHRLRCITRNSIGGVGVREYPPFGFVQESRFEAAIILLNRATRGPGHLGLWKEGTQFFESHAAQDILKEHAQTRSLRNLPLESEIIAKSVGRLPFVTRKGYVGFSTEHIEAGDVVTILQGAQVPYVLRAHSSGTYRLIGEAYVDGIMNGEAVEGVTWQPIEIV